MRLALIACRSTPTNDALSRAVADGQAWEPMTPHRALDVLRPGDAALGRLDVLPTLDGMDDGLWALGALAARGVHVLNDPAALLAAHDKLLTARLFRRRNIVHPATIHVRNGRAAPQPMQPVVLKPRFGSWGREVYRCDDHSSFTEALARVQASDWYRRHGALVQELVPPQGYDLRILVQSGGSRERCTGWLRRVSGARTSRSAACDDRSRIHLARRQRSRSPPPERPAPPSSAWTCFPTRAAAGRSSS